MTRTYSLAILRDYVTYRRDIRTKFGVSRGKHKNHMEFEEFETMWLGEFDGEETYQQHVRHESRQEIFI